MIASFATVARAAVVSYTLDVRNWVVDYQRPTALPRQAPHDLPAAARMDAILANNSYPGPAIEAYEGDAIHVTVLNNNIDGQVSLLFDGLEVVSAPEALIPQQGGEGRYALRAPRAGTFVWRAAVARQAASGLRGAIVIRQREHDGASEELERMVVLSDARARPDVCFGADGHLAGGCPLVDRATLNGQWGDGRRGYPKPVITVEQGSCYRLRFLGLATLEKPYFVLVFKDHQLTVLRGNSSETASAVDVHAGEAVDAVLCANRRPLLTGDWPITVHYVGESHTPTFEAVLHYKRHWLNGDRSGEDGSEPALLA